MEDDAPPGVPEWVVTYGDMMSLLLTFFIMLVSLSEVVADKKYQAIMEALMTYTGYETAPKAPEGKNFPLSGMVEKLETLGSYNKIDEGNGGNKSQGPEGDERVVRRYPEGLAQPLLPAIPFAPGSVELSSTARELLLAVETKIAGKPQIVEIHGYASDAPLPPAIPESADPEASQTSAEENPDDALEISAARKFANEQLSYLRAKAVYAELIQLKIRPKRLRIRAIGAVPTADDTSDNNAHPDRVEVHILDQNAGDRIGRDTGS